MGSRWHNPVHALQISSNTVISRSRVRPLQSSDQQLPSTSLQGLGGKTPL
jgi:hypothetical protein